MHNVSCLDLWPFVLTHNGGVSATFKGWPPRMCCSHSHGHRLTHHLNAWPFDCVKLDWLTLWPHKYYCSPLRSNCWIYCLTPSDNTPWSVDPCLKCLLTLDFILTVASTVIVTKGIWEWLPLDFAESYVASYTATLPSLQSKGLKGDTMMLFFV